MVMTEIEHVQITFPLNSSRLILRPFTADDVQAFSRYRSDPLVARYQSWDLPFTLAQAERFVAEMQAAVPGTPGEWYQLALERKSGGELIGDCAFVVLAEDPRQAEIGFSLAREYQGQGYAGEAVARLLDFLFRDLGLHRVRANCDPENGPSARVLQRAGMRHEGSFVESLWFKGRWVGEEWYAILAREWQ
jgi:RimJ/RimL family protein N-acetyltransferase